MLIIQDSLMDERNHSQGVHNYKRYEIMIGAYITWGRLGPHHWPHRARCGGWGGLNLEFVDTGSGLVRVSGAPSEVFQSNTRWIQVLCQEGLVLRDVLIGHVRSSHRGVGRRHWWGWGLSVGHWLETLRWYIGGYQFSGRDGWLICLSG